jgi:hypothetical protein
MRWMFRFTLIYLLSLTSACSMFQNKNSFPPKQQQLIELTGKPNTTCEVLINQKSLGIFTVPATINLGSITGKLEAKCTLDGFVIVPQIRSDNHIDIDAEPAIRNEGEPKPRDCQDQLVVKGPCTRTTSTVESVEIIIRQSK